MPLLNKTRPLYYHIQDVYYRMAEDLLYRDNVTEEIYRVKAGFKWDKGSVPKIIPRFLVPHGDEMTYPSAVHDQHYTLHNVSRATADRVLRQFLIEEGMPRWRAWTAWSAVRLNLAASLKWGKNNGQS